MKSLQSMFCDGIVSMNRKRREETERAYRKAFRAAARKASRKRSPLNAASPCADCAASITGTKQLALFSFRKIDQICIAISVNQFEKMSSREIDHISFVINWMLHKGL